MKTLSYFYEPIIKIFDYKGRATRSQYWIWFGITALWYFSVSAQYFVPAVGQLSLWVNRTFPASYSQFLDTAIYVGMYASYVIAYLPLLAITARRLRDTNAAPWLFKAFITGHIVTGISLLLAFAFWGFAFFAIPGLIMMALFGVGCMIKGLEPSYVAPAPEAEAQRADVADSDAEPEPPTQD